MIKLVAFDWNGTLLADMQCVIDADNEVLPKFGKPKTTLAQAREIFEVPLINFFIKLGFTEEEFRQNADKWAELWHQYYEPRAAHARTRVGTRQALKWLRDNQIQTIIFSNHVAEAIYTQLVRLKIDLYIDTVLAHPDVGMAHYEGKQKRLAEYLNLHKFKPSEVIIVGDTAEEIEIARNLKTISVAFSGGNCSTSRLKAANPDYLISNLTQLEKIIPKLI